MDTAVTFKLGVIFAGINQMQNPMNQINSFADKVSNKFKNISQKISSMVNPANVAGFGLATKMVSDLKESEDAVAQLQNTMMGAGGVVSPYFSEISEKAKELGKDLPGTNADFYKMASILKSLGVGDAALTSSLEATALMATVLKPLGVTYEQAAEGTAKFKNALGIADNDMVKFADTIQRTAHMGVNMTEMQYAFSRMSASVKLMGLEGLENANKFAPLVAMLIKTGQTGETVGTSLQKLLFMGHQKRAFKDIETMFKYLEKTDEKKLEKLFGAGGQDLMTAISLKQMGLKKYIEAQKEMQSQANMDMRVNNSLKTLGNVLEAMMGTVTNLSVSFGKVFGMQLKSWANGINDFADRISSWMERNSTLMKQIGSLVVWLGKGYVAFKLYQGVQAFLTPVLSGIIFITKATGLMTAAQQVYNTVVAMSPIGQILLLITGTVVALQALEYALTNVTSKESILNDIRSEASGRIGEEVGELDFLFWKLKQTNAGSEERIKIVEEINAKHPTYLKGINAEASSVEELTTRYNDLSEEIKNKAQQEVAAEKLKYLFKKQAEEKYNKEEYKYQLSQGGFTALKAYSWESLKHGIPLMDSVFDNNANDEKIKQTQSILDRMKIDKKAKEIEKEKAIQITNHVNVGSTTMDGHAEIKKATDESADALAQKIAEIQRKQTRGAYASRN